MPILVPPLVYRIEKGSPVTALEEDTNLKTLKNSINGLAALFGLAFDDSGALRQLPDRFVLQRNLVFPYSFYAVDTGAPNALAIAFVPPATAYVPGINFFIKLNNPITGATTLNVDGLGAVAVKKEGNVDLETGDGIVGQVLHVIHNGTNFQLVNTLASAPIPFVTGVVSEGAGTDNVTALGPGDTQVGTHQLALPVGKRWTWVKHVFSTTLSALPQQGIDQIKLKLGTDVMPWTNNLSPSGYLTGGSGQDIYQVTFVTEGEPTGHDTDANLQVTLFARQKSGVGDTPAARKLFSVAWYQ